MIIAAGLTPAWQTIMRFEKLAIGEVNRAVEVHQFASGKVLNVAVALAHMEVPCEAISIVGGTPRERIDQDLSVLGIARHWIISKSPTRSCVTLLDDTAVATTELVENASPVTTSELEEFAAVFAHEAEHAKVVVLTGSLPRGTPATIYRELLTNVTCPVILDARGPELLAALVHRPWLVKPNREELAATLRTPVDTDTELQLAMRELVNRGAQRILVSDGARLAWLLDGGKLYRISPAVVAQVINPIGGGDCLAAGIATMLHQGNPVLDCIAFGMAAAAENAGQLLTGRLDLDAVRNRISHVRIDAV